MTPLVRVYPTSGAHPTRWNTFRMFGPLASARFDTHPPTSDGQPVAAPGHGVTYFGLSLQTAVAEAFGARGHRIDRRTRRPYLVVFRPSRTVRLLDLSGVWPTRAGWSQEINNGPRERSRAWARAVRIALPDLDGLWYRSSMNGGEPAVCLWEPARDALSAEPELDLPLDAPGLDLPLARIVRELRYLLV